MCLRMYGRRSVLSRSCQGMFRGQSVTAFSPQAAMVQLAQWLAGLRYMIAPIWIRNSCRRNAIEHVAAESHQWLIS